MEKVLDYPCSCGGTLKKSFCSVEFFGINFGENNCEVCTKCGSEYLDDETLGKIEEEVKKKIKQKDIARIFPISKKKIEIELLG